MGTTLRAQVWASSAEKGFAAIESGFLEVKRLEGLLSSWREDSELSLLNATPAGQPVRPSAELWQLLREVWGWSQKSAGAFDPAVGALIDAWDLRGAGRRPTEVELRRALAAVGSGAFELDEASGTVTRLVPGAWLTAGGFGKGAALRSVEDRLDEAGVEAALLDFGGQLHVVGSPPGGALRMGVAHPLVREQTAAILRLSEGSVATSAASERFLEVDGERLGHILDPRTGLPVPAWGSVTVVARDPLLADLLSTALFVLGPEVGLSWAESWQDIGVLFLRADADGLRRAWNPAMQRWLVDEGRSQ